MLSWVGCEVRVGSPLVGLWGRGDGVGLGWFVAFGFGPLVDLGALCGCKWREREEEEW